MGNALCWSLTGVTLVRDPMMVPVREPTIVPVREPTIVPVREPTIVPVRDPLPLDREPTIVPPSEMVAKDKIKVAAIRIRRSCVMINAPSECSFAGS